VPIHIHPDLEALLQARAEAAGITVDAYIERIPRDDQAAEEELETLALEGLNRSSDRTRPKYHVAGSKCAWALFKIFF